MSVDVGDAVELTFATTTGADVTVSWIDPDGVTVLDQVDVAEAPAASGLFPYTFLPTAAGVWTAQFVASGAATSVERYYVRASSLTGPAPLATVGDIVGQFGALTAAQETLTNALIKAASAMVRGRFPAVDTLIAEGRLNSDLVALAVTNMVLRVLRNPSGLRAETIGPFSRTYDTKYAAGLLVLGEDELPLLTPPLAATSLSSPVGTIMLRPGMAPPPYGVTRGWI